MEAVEDLALLLLAEIWVQELPLEQPDVEVWQDVVLVFPSSNVRKMYRKSVNPIGTILTTCNSNAFWSRRIITELRAMLAPAAGPQDRELLYVIREGYEVVGE